MILIIIEVFLVSDFTVSVVPGERFDQIYAPRPHVGVHVLAGPMPTVVRIARFARTLGAHASISIVLVLSTSIALHLLISEH